MIRMAFSAERLAAGRIILDAAEAHYLGPVMRLQSGEAIEALVEGLGLFRAVLAQEGRVLTVEESIAKVESRLMEITLCPALIKHDLLAEVVEKGTEVGISAFEPWVSERSVVRSVSENKWLRWRAIAKEASEQSRRNNLPEFFSLKDGAEGLALAPDQLGIVWDPNGMALRDWWHDFFFDRSVKTVTGPEGGISPAEREVLLAQGFSPVRLGPQIYRAENAGVFGALLLQFLASGSHG